MTKEEQAKKLLDKYAEGKTSPAETKQVESWYASYENHNLDLSDHRKAEIGKNVAENIAAILDRYTEPKTRRLVTWSGLIKVAAVLLLISAAAAITWTFHQRDPVGVRMAEIRTSKNERKTIRLSDGSEIILNPSAVLRYPVKFAEGSRKILLAEGAAFFDIAHDEKRPFTVETSDGIYTKVLGTSFNIRSYKADKKISIEVLTGKVAIGRSTQEFATLTKGQQITYDKHAQRAVVDYIPAPVYAKIEFEGETLLDVCRKLEYVYSITINLASKDLNKLKCRATFSTKQTPAEILTLLCSLHHLKFESNKQNTFNIYKK